MTFTETWRGHWESDKMSISAAIITRDDEGNSTGLVHDSVALYEIEEGEYKGQTAYRLYKAHLGGRSFVKRFKTLEQAVKFAEADDKK